MLRLRTYLDRSAVHGIGLFAAEDAEAGTVLWELNPMVDMVFSEDEWRDMKASCTPASLEQMMKYSYKEDGRYVICLDNAQFMNHARGAAVNVLNDKARDVMYAARRIRAGEELFCDYSEYCDGDDCNLSSIAGPS